MMLASAGTFDWPSVGETKLIVGGELVVMEAETVIVEPRILG